MPLNSNPPVRDWGLYGLIVGFMALFVAGIGLIAFLISAEGRATRAEQATETEKTRRYVAEEIAKANERAAVNAFRIDHLNEQVKPSHAPPPEN